MDDETRVMLLEQKLEMLRSDLERRVDGVEGMIGFLEGGFARIGDVPRALESGPSGRLFENMFTGIAYVCGKKITGLNGTPAKPWVKVAISTLTATEETNPPSDPFPENEEWYLKATTAGDIHVTRF